MSDHAIVSVRLPVSTLDRCKRVAEADERPTSYVIRRLVERGLDQLERQRETSAAPELAGQLSK